MTFARREFVVAENGRNLTRGDRVRPTYGGPVLTVEEVYPEVFKYRYRCVWTDPHGNPQHEFFRAEQIERAPDDE